MRVRGHVEWHVIEFRRQISPMIQIEGAQKVLIGLSLAGVLRDNEPGNVLEDRARPQQWLTGKLILTDVAGRGCRDVTDPGGNDGDLWKARFAGGSYCVAPCAVSQEEHRCPGEMAAGRCRSI